MGVRKTTEEFISEAKVVHGNKYDYSNVIYVKAADKVLIICKEHGEFLQRAGHHLRGINCPKCFGTVKKTTEEFIKDAKSVHGDKYDYSKVVYVTAGSKVVIACTKHDDFLQSPNHHLSGVGCPKCSVTGRKTTEEFISEAKAVHGDKYDYSKVVYVTSGSKVIIVCKKHCEFSQTPNNHLKGIGCQKCSNSGFDNSKQSTFYMYTFEKYVGFGISNNFKRRNTVHMRTFKNKGIDANLVVTYNMTGILAQSLEKYIKQTLPIINTGIDGFKTEAVHINDLPILLDTIKQYEPI